MIQSDRFPSFLTPHHISGGLQQSHAETMVCGYIYAVCQQGDYASVKIGLTTVLSVERFVCDNYNRSLAPLQLIHVLPTSNCRLAESVVHHFLNPCRLHSKHELFDLSDGFHKLHKALNIVQELDQEAQLPFPIDRPFDLDRWRLTREAARTGSIWISRRRQRERQQEQAEVSRAERNRIKAQAEVLRAERAEVEAEIEQQRQIKDLLKDMLEIVVKEADNETKDYVRMFLDDAVTRGADTDYVKAKELYKKFEAMMKGGKRHKRTMKYRDFRDGLERVLKTTLKERHLFIVDGKQREVKSALVGYKRLQM